MTWTNTHRPEPRHRAPQRRAAHHHGGGAHRPAWMGRRPARNAIGAAAPIIAAPAVAVGLAGLLVPGLLAAAWPVAAALGVTAVALGALGMNRVTRRLATNDTTALAGVTAGVVAVILAAIGAVLLLAAPADAAPTPVSSGAEAGVVPVVPTLPAPAEVPPALLQQAAA